MLFKYCLFEETMKYSPFINSLCSEMVQGVESWLISIFQSWQNYFVVLIYLKVI